MAKLSKNPNHLQRAGTGIISGVSYAIHTWGKSKIKLSLKNGCLKTAR